MYGINNAGQIVGAFYVSSSGTGTGFIGTGGSYATIDVPGSYYTTVYGINDVGQAVGSYNNASNAADHGFLYSGGNFATIDVPLLHPPHHPRHAGRGGSAKRVNSANHKSATA